MILSNYIFKPTEGLIFGIWDLNLAALKYVGVKNWWYMGMRRGMSGGGSGRSQMRPWLRVDALWKGHTHIWIKQIEGKSEFQSIRFMICSYIHLPSWLVFVQSHLSLFSFGRLHIIRNHSIELLPMLHNHCQRSWNVPKRDEHSPNIRCKELSILAVCVSFQLVQRNQSW